MSELVSVLQQLVAIESINPDLVSTGSGEGPIARFVADWLTQAGLEVTIDEPAPGRPNVVAIARGSGGGRSLMLNAHMDTVGVAGMTAPFTPVVREGRLYGRGAYDMKAGLAITMIAAVGAAKRGDLCGDVIVTAVSDEEYASVGSQSIVKRWRADAALITEPTEMQLVVAHKGFMWFDVETQGFAAHGSRPELGIDAIAKMGKVLVGLEELDRALRSKPTHLLLGSGSLHASLITGGQELSSYPDRCRLSVERRTVPGETSESVAAEVNNLLSSLHLADPDFKATLQMSVARDAYSVALDEPVVQILQQQATAAFGKAPACIGQPFWMDTAILGAAGIPCLAFGPGGGGAHAIEEWVELDQLHTCAEIVLATVREFCA